MENIFEFGKLAVIRTFNIRVKNLTSRSFLNLALLIFFILSPTLSVEEIVWNKDYHISHISLSNSPSLAVFKDDLYCAHQGIGEKSHELFYTTTSDGVKWSEGKKVGNASALSSPSLAVFKDKLYCVYQGSEEKSHELWYITTIDGIQWAEEKYIPNKYGLSSPPSLAVFNDKLYCAYQGSGEKSHELWYITTIDGDNWAEDKKVENVGLSSSPSLAVFNNKLYCAHQGIEKKSHELWYITTTDGDKWAEDKKVGNASALSSPSLAVLYGKLYCAFQGNYTGFYPGFYTGSLRYATTSDGVEWDCGPRGYGKRFKNLGVSGSPSLEVFDAKLYVAHHGYNNNRELWCTTSNINIQASLIVSLIDFNFGDVTNIEGILSRHTEEKVIEASTSEEVEIKDPGLGAKISGGFQRNLDQTFSWTLDQQIGLSTETNIKGGVPFIAKGKVELGLDATFGAHQQWSKTISSQFDTSYEMAPEQPGKYRVKKIIYFSNADLPFTAKAHLKAIIKDSSGFNTDLDVSFVEALFKKEGLNATILDRCLNDKYIVVEVTGKLKANYGAWGVKSVFERV